MNQLAEIVAILEIKPLRSKPTELKSQRKPSEIGKIKKKHIKPCFLNNYNRKMRIILV